MDIILAQYEERLGRLRRKRSTIVNFRNAAKRYQDWLDDQGLAATDAESWAIEELFLGMDLAPSTVQQYFNEIRAAYRYARTRKQMTHDPTADVTLPRIPDNEPRIISARELREIKSRIVTDREELIFHLLAYAGLRKSEVLGLTCDAVSLTESTMRVLGKGGKLRFVPIHPALGEVLANVEMVPGAHVVRTKFRQISDNTLEADLFRISPNYTSHTFRRTAATSLARNGVDERVIDRIFGWSARTVRSRYYVNVAVEELQRGILKLYANDPV